MTAVPEMRFVDAAAGRMLKLGSVDFEVETLSQEDLAGDDMKGFRRFLSQVSGRKYCHVAFSLNACLRDSSRLRDICKGQPEMIERAHDTADKMIPKVLGCAVEEGSSTFVLDLCRNGLYQDAEAIGRWEAAFAQHLRSPMKTKDASAAAATHRCIRPWMSYFMAEGSVKCALVQLMQPEESEYLQGDAEGKLLLCMMGLVVIHFLQYGFRLVHRESGTKITAAGVFHDLLFEELEAEAGLERLLARLRADFMVLTMFPGDHYASAYSKACPYVAVMSQLSSLRHAEHRGGRVQILQVKGPQEPELSQEVSISAADPAPSVAVALRGMLETEGSWPSTPSSSPASFIESYAYDPAELIFAGSLRESTLSVEQKMEMVRRVCSNQGELVGEQQLRRLFEQKKHPICYDGFEPSGRMHIAQGILKAVNVNRLTEAGCVFVFWVADWFGLLNNKMGGDLEKIQTVGRYFVEVWKAAGMDMQNVRFLWAAEEINKNPDRYWLLVMNIARSFTLARVKRCSQIMGRAEGDEQPAATIMYPCMQCADVFYLGADICQLGMDQRKVNVLAREFMDRPECRERREKPIIASHGIIPGLLQGQEKMSKSDPDSAIFMEDSPEEVERKIWKAFCPPKEIEKNPCAAYVRHLVFPKDGLFRVSCQGQEAEFRTPEAFEEAYLQGLVEPQDLKRSLAAAINTMIQPVQEHFRTDRTAAQLLETVRRYRVTRASS